MCYGPLSVYRDLFPGWCVTIDQANNIIGSPYTTAEQKALAVGWVMASGTGQGLGILAAAVLVIMNPVGVGTGGAIGAIAGAAYADLRYELAKNNACGCAAKQWADSITDKSQYVNQAATQGAVAGMMAGGTFGLGLYGQIAVSLVGIASGSYGAHSAGTDIAQNNITVCNALDLTLSVGSIAASSFTLQRAVMGLQAIAAATSAATVRPSPSSSAYEDFVRRELGGGGKRQFADPDGSGGWVINDTQSPISTEIDSVDSNWITEIKSRNAHIEGHQTEVRMQVAVQEGKGLRIVVENPALIDDGNWYTTFQNAHKYGLSPEKIEMWHAPYGTPFSGWTQLQPGSGVPRP